MDQATRLCFEEEKAHHQTKSSKVNLEYGYSFPSINSERKPTVGDEENNFTKRRNHSQTEKIADLVDKDAGESTDDSLIMLNSLESGLGNSNSKTRENAGEKEITNKNDEEDEGTYEELICLVRQFYVEKPINPAALAHQNIETC